MRMRDGNYLKDKLTLILSRIDNYTGPEFARDLIRMALVANPGALRENEFAPNSNKREELLLLQRLVDFDAGNPNEDFKDIVISAKEIVEREKPIQRGGLSCCRK